jgi:nitrogen fixation NifU-like protein
MTDLGTLYRDVLLDHGKAPRHLGRLEAPTHAADGDNPLCGDRVRVEVDVAAGRIRQARFTIRGCLVATASASLMTERIHDQTPDEARALCAAVEAACTGTPGAPAADWGALGALTAVRAYPARVRCATLPWHALRRALDGAD